MNRLLLAGTAVLALVLTGCGSAAKDVNGAAGSGEGATNDSKGFGQDGSGRGIPGVSGKVAAVSGSTAQVQSESSQTAVSWTSATSITQEVSTTASAVTVGSCVMAQPDPTNASAGSSDSGSATAVTAATVRIISTTGDCTAGRPGVVRGGPDGGPQVSGPSGAPSGLPSGAPRAGRAQFGAFGKVTAVRSGGFTVSAIVPTNIPGSGSSSGSASGSATPTTRTVTVTTTATTKYTTTKKATGSAVKVGQCLTAQGTTGSTGSVAARRIELTAPVNGQCGLQVFGGRGPGGAGSSNQQFSNGAA